MRLQRGMLQLPAHTQLLLDETRLAAGTLTGAGVDNLKVQQPRTLAFQVFRPARRTSGRAELVMHDSLPYPTIDTPQFYSMWEYAAYCQLAALQGVTGFPHTQAVKELLETKSVEYGFRVYRLPMPADVPVTILSTGTSLLSGFVDVVVPLHAAQAPGALMAFWPCARTGACRALMLRSKGMRHELRRAILQKPPEYAQQHNPVAACVETQHRLPACTRVVSTCFSSHQDLTT